jgi:type II secretory pathway component PulK
MLLPSLPGNHRTRKFQNRRGMVLIVLLVCFALAAAMIIGAVRIALTAHKATQTAAWSVQARWLAESGVERAAAKLAADAAYTGETWTIPAEELGAEESGVVRIEVQPVSGQEKRYKLKIEADFPDDPVHRTRQEKEVVLDIP